MPSRSTFPAKGNWTREQTIIAFYLYCQTPFGRLHSKNKEIVEDASLIGRTPGAVAMKCVNIASLDPVIQQSGRVGLSNASDLDREIWQEFHDDWDVLVDQAEALKGYLANQAAALKGADDPPNMDADFTGETREAMIQQRVKQWFFRRSVLGSYRGRCCISGVTDAKFLVASHIVAWKEDAANRLNPANGLCLSVIHDRAFDQHLFSLTDDHRVVLSRALRASRDDFLRDIFIGLDDKKIELPERFAPDSALMARHRAHMQTIDSEAAK